ncbi:hydroxyacylglutathione hydrolase [Paucibacter sp. PLA-PC-4]|uniref:hydroxyacylglutathione hydrolase n=1 Tax=Paucibacter sp. PLA-PC-4 TaxID=2993655 RepID=UPI002248E23E|nr:hydroxyacylglutathione hydrolase [Paucibacter sp. PLA-PC-4]MCX2862730.1 hydroxyacylglutathione hydrolase [Paucibacter sp. PLA-PC-4]
MDLVALPAFTDNYIWMLHDGAQALVVDPGEAEPVLRALDHYSLRLAGILVTHHHGDHVGGLAGLRPRLQGPVFGPARESIPGPVQACSGGQFLELLGQRIRVIDVPGHTAGHIAYLIESPSDASAPLLFCGDTLFSGGCGRLFEGTPAQMYASLQALAALPGHTRVCCAHEYTLSNLRFARTIEPANPALLDYQAWCETRRHDNLPTLPSTIGQEQAINPFLRCDQPAVRAAALAYQPQPLDTDPVAVFATLRQWKNDFR